MRRRCYSDVEDVPILRCNPRLDTKALAFVFAVVVYCFPLRLFISSPVQCAALFAFCVEGKLTCCCACLAENGLVVAFAAAMQDWGLVLICGLSLPCLSC